MKNTSEHTFHIPVMGLAFTIDTPIKVARFGISSTVSIMQDTLVEQMREFYCRQFGETYNPIPEEDLDHRAKRIRAYLDLMQNIVERQVKEMKSQAFEDGQDIVKYFDLLPQDSPVKALFLNMRQETGPTKARLEAQLREEIQAGSIDVNIMTKVDSLNYTKEGEPLPLEYSDAISALRGFASSKLRSSIVFSAGLNLRLFAFLENLSDFFPDQHGVLKKKIIVKVSDYRSALVQGKFLAKKGLWVSEFRIESGLNCGGHAFPTEGHLIGPILEEFKTKKQELQSELLQLCNQALSRKNSPVVPEQSEIRITVQGGIGTSSEDKFLKEHYQVASTGWGSPFLLVPEATTVDDKTIADLVNAVPEDFYLSHASPLGVPFHNFRRSSSEAQRKARILKNRPGSPCYKQHLTFNTEFSKEPICTASREYQNKKLKSLNLDSSKSSDQNNAQFLEITEKACLCEGLSTAALLKHEIKDPHHLNAVAICPGPNMAYFSKVVSLNQMVDHIYGRSNILNSLSRPHMFIKELTLYVDYFKKEVARNSDHLNAERNRYLASFKANLLQGIEYYKNLLPKITREAEDFKLKMKDEFDAFKFTLGTIFPGNQGLQVNNS